jgi:DNA-binding protein HU-beta
MALNDIQCAYIIPPRCPNLVKGKGLYCSVHKPLAGTIKKVMTQSQVITHFVEQTSLDRAQVQNMFQELSRLAAREVRESGEFVLPGFGKLMRTQRAARLGRNPATGATIQIPARTTLKFRVGRVMKDTVLSEEVGSTEPVSS